MHNLKKILFLFFSLCAISTFSQEICDNGIDDDGDGLIDLNDVEDCVCEYLGGNTEVESLIPNASFEDTDCCPSSYSALNCASTWIQASTATSDYMNTCDFMPSVVPLPIPEGEAIVGAIFLNNWYECVGACLNEPFEAGEDYLLNMQIASNMADGGLGYVGPNDLGPIDITIFGSPNCSDLPFAGTLCPLDDVNGEWEIIGTYTYDPLGEWQEIIFELSSTVDINAIVIGPPCGMPDAYENNFGDYAYFMYDDLVLNEASLFSSTVSGSYYDEENDVLVVDGEIYNEDTGEWDFVGSICSDIVELVGNADTTGTFQWYYEGVAMVGETDTVLQMNFDDHEQGEYQFVLYIDGTSECTSAVYTTDVPDYPVADYEVGTVCYPGEVEFTDLSTYDSGDLIDWEWTVNEELIVGSYQEISHFFGEAGPHEVQLVVQSQNFCRDTLITNVTMDPTPEVNFSIENACVGELTSFVDETVIDSGSSLAEWSWNFDDGGATSTDQNPTHTFDVYQEYSVALEVTSDDGCFSDTTITISAYPTPQLGFTNTMICIESPVAEFDNISSITSGSIAEWLWDFGDDETSTNESPSHIYSEAGEYDITLTGVSNFGCEITINGLQQVAEVVSDFDYGIVEGCAPFCTDFQQLATTNFGLIEDVSWSFSNGENSSNNELDMCFDNPSHTDVLKHSVSLTAINTYGCQHTFEIEDLISVWPVPNASFTATPEIAPFLSPEITFTNQSIGNAENYWNFGDGKESTELNPFHLFGESLVYQVSLEVVSDSGCTDKAYQQINILPQYNIYVPNAFTPQGDGINETFYPVISGGVIQDFSFEIRNQWNEVVFYTNDPNETWNGSYADRQDYFAQDGVYVWSLVVKFERLPEAFENKGTVLITR